MSSSKLFISLLFITQTFGCIEERPVSDEEQMESGSEGIAGATEGGDDRAPEQCDPRIDEDGDVRIDCDDPTCADSEACRSNIPDPTDCTEDDDGLVDCESPDCVDSPRCDPAEICHSSRVVSIELDEVYIGLNQAEMSQDRGSCGGSGSETVYTYTAANTGALCVSTVGSESDTVLYVRAECTEPESELACNDDFDNFNAALTLEVEAGAVYSIFVDHFISGDPTNFQLSVTLGACDEPTREEEEEEEEDCDQPGDENQNGVSECEDRACLDRPECAQQPNPIVCTFDQVTVLESWGTYMGTTEGASNELRGRCGGEAASERVFAFTPGNEGPFCVSTKDSTYDTLLHVRKECDQPNSELQCIDDFYGVNAALTIEGRASSPYFIIVDGFRREGAFTLTISEGVCEPPPTEDCSQPGDEDGNGLADCEDRACIDTQMCTMEVPSVCEPSSLTTVGVGTYTASALDAPQEVRGSCAGRGSEVAFIFTPEEERAYCLNTLGSTYDTVLYVRSECADAESELACNDDFNGFNAAITLDATAQTPYFVFIDNFRSGEDSFRDGGEYTLTIEEGECVSTSERCAQEGDEDRNGLADCDDPACINHPSCIPPEVCRSDMLIPIIALGSYQGLVTQQESSARGSCGGAGAEVVYTFSVAGDSPLCLSTDGADYDTVLYVRTECGDPESEVACNDDYIQFSSALTLNAQANTPYYLFVDSFGQSGEYDLHLSVGACDPPLTLERCDLRGDEDRNGLADCDDPACVGFPGCISPIRALACDSSVLVPLNTLGVYSGDTSDAPSGEAGSCSGSGREVVYAFTPSVADLICIQTSEVSFSSALYVRTACAQESRELACDHLGESDTAQITLNTEADHTYYIFVDGEDSNGSYDLSLSSGACPER